MSGEHRSSPWLPGVLIVLGILAPVAGFAAGGPDAVGGVVFGLLSVAAAVAILSRRARDARQHRPGNGGAGRTK